MPPLSVGLMISFLISIQPSIMLAGIFLIYLDSAHGKNPSLCMLKVH